MKERIGILKPDGKSFSTCWDQPDINHTGFEANERCTILLAVDRESQERRVQLMKEKAVIGEAQAWLEGLTNSAGVVVPRNPFL